MSGGARITVDPSLLISAGIVGMAFITLSCPFSRLEEARKPLCAATSSAWW